MWGASVRVVLMGRRYEVFFANAILVCDCCKFVYPISTSDKLGIYSASLGSYAKSVGMSLGPANVIRGRAKPG
jgi:hypothetical protein